MWGLGLIFWFLSKAAMGLSSSGPFRRTAIELATGQDHDPDFSTRSSLDEMSASLSFIDALDPR